jgi:hypothetical protein
VWHDEVSTHPQPAVGWTLSRAHLFHHHPSSLLPLHRCRPPRASTNLLRTPRRKGFSASRQRSRAWTHGRRNGILKYIPNEHDIFGSHAKTDDHGPWRMIVCSVPYAGTSGARVHHCGRGTLVNMAATDICPTSSTQECKQVARNSHQKPACGCDDHRAPVHMVPIVLPCGIALSEARNQAPLLF